MTGETIDQQRRAGQAAVASPIGVLPVGWLDEPAWTGPDPQVNLLAADLAGLPPIAVYYGTDELLASEAAELARRAKAAGNDVIVGRSKRVSTPSSSVQAGCLK